MTPHAPRQDTLGLWPEPLPTMPRVVEGFESGDKVWLWEGERRCPARVIAVLRSCHTVVLSTVDHRIVSIKPAYSPTAICKRSTT